MYASQDASRLRALLVTLALVLGMGLAVDANPAVAKEKVKVLYHIDGNDLATAKYAMALIHKHIEAEGGPENIDVKVVVHGPALTLFKEETVDPQLKETQGRTRQRRLSRNVPSLDETVRNAP